MIVYTLFYIFYFQNELKFLSFNNTIKVIYKYNTIITSGFIIPTFYSITKIIYVIKRIFGYTL